MSTIFCFLLLHLFLLSPSEPQTSGSWTCACKCGASSPQKHYKMRKGERKKRISSINDRSSDTRRNLNLTNSYPLIRNSVFTVFIETRSEHSISVIPKSMRRKTKLLSFIFRGGDRIGTMCLGDTMCLYEIRDSFSKYLRWFKYYSYDNRNKPYPLCVKNIQFNTTFTEQCNTIVSLRIFFARWAAVPDFHFWVPFNSLLWSRLFLELELFLLTLCFIIFM